MAQTGLQDYIPKQHAAFVKKVLKEKWSHHCAYCNYKEKNRELTVDHITPLAKMGTDDYYNLLPACRSCNLSKGNKAIRQWYFDHEEFSTERWLKIKQHMDSQNVLTI